METTTFIKTLHYGTLRIVAIDLVQMVNRCLDNLSIK